MSGPVAFLIGAGASYPYGVPLMVGLYDGFHELVERRYRRCLPLLELLTRPERHARPDLETLLSDLQETIASAAHARSLGHNLAGLEEQASLATELRGYLDAYIVDSCERFDRQRAFREMKRLLDLSAHGPLWIFTTNYDRIIEYACEHHGIVFADGFEAEGDQPVADWSGRFGAEVNVVKLHGSVNWYEDDPGGGLHRLDRGYALPSHEFRLTRGGQMLKPLMIIPTLEKEALGKPYVQLAMKFTDVLEETQILVVAGSSLRDRHLRSYIEGRLDGLYVVLVSPSADDQQNIFDRSDRTFALSMGFSEFLTVGGEALTRLVAELGGDGTDDGEVRATIEEFVRAAATEGREDAEIAADNPDLAKALQDTREGSVAQRARAATALAQHVHPAVRRRLTAVLQSDPDAPARVAAVSSLLRVAGSEAIPVLAQALERDPSQDVQMEAALALARFDGEETIGAALRAALERDDLSPATRMFIAEIIAP